MKSNITQAFFWKTGKKMEINSTVTGIIDYKCAKCTKKTLEILFIIQEMHIERRKNEKEC